MNSSRRTKKNAVDWEGLKKAREGKISMLDQVELDDDDNVFDVVDEDEYAKLVESRRNAGDFVVDDDGIGYYDDGEEHLGIEEDAYEIKKQMALDAAQESEAKLSKKAKKLAEMSDPKQKTTLMNFVKPMSTKPIAKPSLNTSTLDIDVLLEEMDKSKAPRNSVQQKPFKATKPLVKPPMMSWKPTLPSFSRMNVPFIESSPEENEINNTTNNFDTYSTPDHVRDTFMSNEAPTDFLEPVKIEEEAPIKAEESIDAKQEKRSLATTTRKFKLVDEPPQQQKFAMESNSIDNTFSMSSDIFLSQSDDRPVNAIDAKRWLKRSEPSAELPEGEEYLELFWTDASESNGIIYLLGKVALSDSSGDASMSNQFVSCCVAVHGCERNLFVLPKETGQYNADGTPIRASMTDVYSELNKLLVPNIIPRQQGQGFRCKQVKRNYAFECPNVPREETDYLKVVYSAKHGLPTSQQCDGGKYIERIFGISSSPLEWFLLKRQILGPCWLKIRKPRMIPEPISWCKLEVVIESPKLVSAITDRKIPNPPIVTMTISMKTVVNPSTHTHEIVALSALIHTNVNIDGDTDGNNRKNVKQLAFIRQLGLSCGNNYPTVFPHDLAQEIKKTGNTFIQTVSNERALLSLFSAKLGFEDPDVIVSHNLLGFELEILYSRAIANKVPQLWNKLGRLRRSKPPKSHLDKDLTAGRVLCDTYKAAKEFLRETSYSLTSLSASQLFYKRIEIDPVDVPKYFSSSSEIIQLVQHTVIDNRLVQQLMLKLQVIPLTKQLTNLSGNLWSRTMRGARAERIEYLLMHEFHKYKFILPERKFLEQSNSHDKKTAVDDDDDDDGHDGPGNGKVGGRSRTRGKAAYAGGLVLEPKKGLYDTFILLLDFNSLYPSIIQEYNLCFTTIDWTKFMGDSSKAVNINGNDSKSNGKGKKSGKKDKKSTKKSLKEKENAENDGVIDESNEIDSDDDDVDEIDAPATNQAKELPPLPDPGIKVGHLPKVIKGLVDRRREVKNLLKKERDPALKQQLDIRQKALKLTANSMYGCLGFTFSRFYARPIAALVTAKGREALQRTVDFATKQMNLDVIYGDTDSVMINTNSTDLAQVKEIGNLVKREVNKLYKALELDLDGIFKSMLLLKKKKYAAIVIKEIDDKTIQYEKEMKGLDLVRRDWCPLSQDTGRYIVDQILSGNPREDIVASIHDYLRNLSSDIRNGKISLDKFVVTKGLNKHPKDYPDCKGQAHLQVALQMLKMNIPVNVGDHIPYVICSQGPDGSTAPQRAHHPDEIIRSNGELTIDYEWYLSNQILPPVTRLCEPIEGTSAAILSTQLGLDASKYVRTSTKGDLLEDDWGFTPKAALDDTERFKDCKKLSITCFSCKQPSVMTGILSETGQSSGLYCQNCGSVYFGLMQPSDCYCYLSNRASMLVRECLKKYYDCWLVCDDHTCGRRTQQQSVMGAPLRCTGDCHGHIIQEYDAEALHNQLKYLESLFDHERLQRKLESQSVTNPNDETFRRKKTLETIPRDHLGIFALLKAHMNSIAVKESAYNWVRPSLFTALFKSSNGDNTNKKTNATVMMISA